MSKVLMPIAEGFEEAEAVIMIDVLRRSGFEVTTLGTQEKKLVRGAHNITIEVDTIDDDAFNGEYDLVLLPGGMPGSLVLKNDPRLTSMLIKQVESGKHVGAICAAPIALEEAGVLNGQDCTSYPGFKDQLLTAFYLEDRVVDSGLVLTSRGPGTAFEFALYIVEKFKGEKVAEEQAHKLLVKDF